VAALIDTAGHHTFTPTIMGNRSGDPKTVGSNQSFIIRRKMTSRISSSSRMKLPCGRARMAFNPAEFVPSGTHTLAWHTPAHPLEYWFQDCVARKANLPSKPFKGPSRVSR
jgi:hypothetical protein